MTPEHLELLPLLVHKLSKSTHKLVRALLPLRVTRYKPGKQVKLLLSLLLGLPLGLLVLPELLLLELELLLCLLLVLPEQVNERRLLLGSGSLVSDPVPGGVDMSTVALRGSCRVLWHRQVGCCCVLKRLRRRDLCCCCGYLSWVWNPCGLPGCCCTCDCVGPVVALSRAPRA